MPEISGLELLRRLKSSGIGCPVIVITGQADVPVAVEAIKLGAADFIEKPYDAEVLLGAVRSALVGRRATVAMPKGPGFSRNWPFFLRMSDKSSSYLSTVISIARSRMTLA